MKYPVSPSLTERYAIKYDPDWYSRDFFYSPDGIKEHPTHHCKLTWLISEQYIKQSRNAIDVGCRDGEYTRYLTSRFKHTYCFDPRLRDYFFYNVDLSKVTHFHCLVGEGSDSRRIGHDRQLNGNFYCIDDFGFIDIDYIKIDTDGYEMAVIKGALETIKRDWPILVLEVHFERQTLEFCLNELGYKHVATCPRGWDHILVKE